MATHIDGYVNVTSGSEEMLKVAIATHGPTAVGIDASHKSFSFYSDGVYFEPKCGKIRLVLIPFATYQRGRGIIFRSMRGRVTQGGGKESRRGRYPKKIDVLF